MPVNRSLPHPHVRGIFFQRLLIDDTNYRMDPITRVGKPSRVWSIPLRVGDKTGTCRDWNRIVNVMLAVANECITFNGRLGTIKWTGIVCQNTKPHRLVVAALAVNHRTHCGREISATRQFEPGLSLFQDSIIQSRHFSIAKSPPIIPVDSARRSFVRCLWITLDRLWGSWWWTSTHKQTGGCCSSHIDNNVRDCGRKRSSAAKQSNPDRINHHPSGR